jgi:purine-nucleoside phosphorylase
MAASRLRRRAGGALDVAIVLGSGLSGAVRERIAGVEIAYEKLDGAPRAPLAGHPGVAYAGTWAGKRVAAFAGRVHLYQGFSARKVTYFVRLAAAAGARTVILTNAAGGLNESYLAGDLMVIADHLNLTGATPLDARHEPDPFLNMHDAYAPRLRALAHEVAGAGALREGVYAGVAGPAYETPAESRALRALGADAVGMSTVLETILARALGLDVLGISVLSNVIGASAELSHAAVVAASESAGERISGLIEGVLQRL